jgi:asparagine synthase (glutamine-hydrolysing)
MIGVHGFVRYASPNPAEALNAMIGRMREPSPDASVLGPMHGIAAVGGASTTALHRSGTQCVALSGHPYWEAGGSRDTEVRGVASRFAEAYATRGETALACLHGDFAIALVDPARDVALLAVDRMSVQNIVYAELGGGLAFGPTCDALARLPGATPEVDPQQVFNYLYFHMVPGPATIYRGWRRVPPGHFVQYASGRITVGPHWTPGFAADAGRDLASFKRDFRAALEDAVRTAADAKACGAFLSGGTDSSTISGLLGAVTRQPARTFSIGFDAAGYDEMEFARTAARHFGTEQHEYYVTPADVVETLPRMVEAYDQPFGNASAVPTYHCARLAREHGVERILGGDGGDELYGGNARYARQRVFARYDALPAGLRRAIVEPLARRLPMTDSVALLRKARSYVEQASQPMPERYESYNLLERLGLATVLTPDFLRVVDTGAPRRHMRELWDATPGDALINRMLALDFRLTLADNDLPKVTRMCALAGIDVAFPMLHDPVIDLSLALPADYKLRGTTLRWFFKESLKDFLPNKIITKEKHGFGLPVGAWLRSHPPLRALASDALASLRQREIVRGDFIDRLMHRQLDEHPGYYGVMVWILTALELWFRRGTRSSD